MSKTNCTFSFCDNQLLNKDKSILSTSEKQHIRRFHQHATYIEGIDGVVLTFRRDPHQDMAYVCPCGSKQACIDGLKIHVRGSNQTSMKRKGCSVITKLAKEVRLSSKSLHEESDDEEIPFNAKPISSKNSSSSTTKKAKRSSSAESLDDDNSGDCLSSHGQRSNGSSEYEDALSIYDIGRLHASFGLSDGSHGSLSKEDVEIQEALERLRKAHEDVQKLILRRIKRRRVEQ